MTDTPRARGLDVSGLNQLPQAMRYAEWAALGFCFGFYEVAIGTRRIPHAQAHYELMQAAGYLTGPYQALHEADDPRTQAALLKESARPGDRFAMQDFERDPVTEAMLRAFCDEYDDGPPVPLILYLDLNQWARVPKAARQRYAGYDVILPRYPFDAPSNKPQPMDPASVARRSNPPPEALRPPTPEPFTDFWSWQHTGHGSLPRYASFLDLHVHRLTQAELRARYAGGGQPPPPADPGVEPAAAIRARAIDIQGLVR